ncbi:MAG: hypothetical protein H7308_02805 [Chthonomonadaceae bacterium]|nr:hypothetical protein [Chthonomonadaceae bacterium]
MTTSRVLTPEQITHFIEKGYVHLKGAFSREDALDAQDIVWKRLEQDGVLKDDPSTWTKPMVHLHENFSGGAFDRCATERLEIAIEDLVGEGRWRNKGKPVQWGWWPVNFSVGSEEEWAVPKNGWHWDGIHFQHTVHAKEQGLLALCFFSENKPKGGITVVVEGSHRIVARYLASQAEPLDLNAAIRECNLSHPYLAELTGKTEDTRTPQERNAYFMDTETPDVDGGFLRVVETVAEPGDVYLCHPFLYHSASQNHLRIPRFMCNRTTPLADFMQLEREDGDYSPLERSVREAVSPISPQSSSSVQSQERA